MRSTDKIATATGSENKPMPLVAVMANSGDDGGLGNQSVDNKYLQAVLEGAGAIPVIIPTLFSQRELAQIIETVDGIVLTGDGSNMQPELYGAAGDADSHGPFDAARDSAALWLIEQALAKDIPMLGICRGMQEMNVALGGTLRNDIVDNPAFFQHGPLPMHLPPEARYAPSQHLQLTEKGLLRRLLQRNEAAVNSLHEQAVAELADALVLDARADDGMVEAFHHPEKRFFLGVQWHAEFNASKDPVSQPIFAAFADAVFQFNRARVC